MEPLIEYERALASLAEAVEAYTTNPRLATLDAMEAALADAKRVMANIR